MDFPRASRRNQSCQSPDTGLLDSGNVRGKKTHKVRKIMEDLTDVVTIRKVEFQCTEIKEKGIFPCKKVHYQVGDDDTT